MGLSCSGDESNRNAFIAFVDQDFPAQAIEVGDLLQATRKAWIPRNLEKLQSAEPKVAWVGYELQHGYVTVDPGPDVEVANSDVTAYANHAIITRTAATSSNENMDLPTVDESAVPLHLPDPLVDEFCVLDVIIGVTVIIPR
jgi:hypothetical protein